MNRNRSLTACASAILLCVGLTACTGSTATSGTAGTVGGAAGGAVGGAAAVGGEAPVTDVQECEVNFQPSAATNNNQAMGMTWGAGSVTFEVDVACSAPMSRGTLTYQIAYTGYTGNQVSLSPPSPYNMAGITSKSFPYTVPCKAGLYIFQYQFEATVHGASANKQDANTMGGVMLTSSNCKQ